MKHWKNKAEFKGRILHWADKLGVRVRMATVRPMRNKWASCSTAGNLHFNAELLLLDRNAGDYVIVCDALIYLPFYAVNIRRESPHYSEVVSASEETPTTADFVVPTFESFAELLFQHPHDALLIAKA